MVGRPRALDELVQPQRLMNNTAMEEESLLLDDLIPHVAEVNRAIEYLSERGLLAYMWHNSFG